MAHRKGFLNLVYEASKSLTINNALYICVCVYIGLYYKEIYIFLSHHSGSSIEFHFVCLVRG